MIRTISGSNSYQLQAHLNDITVKFQDEHGDSIERFDGSELTGSDAVIDAVRSISFLEPKKLVIVRQFSASKDLLDKIESLVEQTADSTELLLVDGKVDKRTSAYKFLQKNSEFEVFGELEPHELKKWITEKSRVLGINMSASTITFLIERVGSSQLQLAQELNKLALVEGEVTRELIEALVEATPQSKVFSLLDALFQGNLQKTSALYEDQRAQGEEPQKILGMIVWQLQQLTLAVFSPIKTVNALRDAGMSPYSAQKALDMARNITPTNLRFYVHELAQLDAQSKTNADIESTLAVYFSEVASRQQLTIS